MAGPNFNDIEITTQFFLDRGVRVAIFKDPDSQRGLLGVLVKGSVTSPLPFYEIADPDLLPPEYQDGGAIAPSGMVTHELDPVPAGKVWTIKKIQASSSINWRIDIKIDGAIVETYVKLPRTEQICPQVFQLAAGQILEIDKTNENDSGGDSASIYSTIWISETDA